MTYEYRCTPCHVSFEERRGPDELENPCPCPRCGQEAERYKIVANLYFNNTAVYNAEYNPGLGCVVKSQYHKSELMKEKRLEEIGNEKPDTIHKHYDDSRQQKWETEWEKVDRGWVGDGS